MRPGALYEKSRGYIGVRVSVDGSLREQCFNRGQDTTGLVRDLHPSDHNRRRRGDPMIGASSRVISRVVDVVDA